MKKNILLTLIIISCFFCYSYGQTDKQECVYEIDDITGETIYSTVDKMPTPKNGLEELYKKIRQNISLNENTTDSMESRIFIQFIVGIDGQISDEKVLRNISGTNLAEQVLKCVSGLEWESGTCNNNKVPVLYKLPMTICLKQQ